VTCSARASVVFALALVAPLEADDNGGGHLVLPLVLAPAAVLREPRETKKPSTDWPGTWVDCPSVGAAAAPGGAKVVVRLTGERHAFLRQRALLGDVVVLTARGSSGPRPAEV